MKLSEYLTTSATAIFSILLLLLGGFLLYSSLFFTTIISNEGNQHTALAICNLLQNNTCLTRTTTPNHPWIANAGVSQTVNENTTVVLVGAASDPDPNDILGYLWRQIAGPAVVLSNSNSANPTFTAPTISDDTQLKFLLTVADDKSASSNPATVTITVKHINRWHRITSSIYQWYNN